MCLPGWGQLFEARTWVSRERKNLWGLTLLYPIRMKVCKLGSYALEKALVVYIRTKTVELLESFASGSLATKAPLSGQKTQVLISLCDKCPWNEWRCDFCRVNEAGLWRASGCGQRKTVTNHLAPTIIFDKRYEITMPATTRGSGIFQGTLVNYQETHDLGLIAP